MSKFLSNYKAVRRLNREIKENKIRIGRGIQAYLDGSRSTQGLIQIIQWKINKSRKTVKNRKSKTKIVDINVVAKYIRIEKRNKKNNIIIKAGDKIIGVVIKTE